MSGGKARVAFCHLDLGVGGAERFIVDSALEVQRLGHPVVLYTTRYDPERCFPECAQLDVRLVAAWLPRTVCGGLTVLCAILRMWALAVLLLWTRIASRAAPQVIVVDQVAAVVPLLRLAARRVVFYGHFPDQLLASHASPLRRAYRAPFDALERLCTAAAHRVLVNSEYTRRVYADTFGASSAGARADVLYPCVGVPSEAEAAEGRKGWRQGLDPELANWVEGGSLLVSVNRFERKKNVALAVRGLHEVITRHALSSGACARCRLVVAGGFDAALPENAAVYEELRALAEELEVEDRVVFLKNVSDAQRRSLLSAAEAVVYTPENEHFGIVPLEAMAAGCPVVACDSGGPKETVTHHKTGFLTDGTVLGVANAIVTLLAAKAEERAAMAAAARAHVADKFSRGALAAGWRAVLEGLERAPTRVTKKRD